MTDEDHRFSEGQGFGDPYEGFHLDPPEIAVDPDEVDPVDSHVLADLLDEYTLPADRVDAETLLDVGLDYMAINRFEDATETFERAARFTDDDGIEQEAWVNKAVSHAELEEWDAAVGACREAIHVDEEGEFAADAHTNLAYALWEGELSAGDEVLYHAERAVELNERSPQAWYNRGFFLLERGLAEQALDCFENSLRLGMRGPQIHEEKARALEALGEYDEATESVERAEELREDDDPVHLRE